MRCLLLFLRRASLPNTDAYRYLDHFFLNSLRFVKTIAKLNFKKYRVLEPRTAQNCRPRRAEAKDNTVKDFTNLSSRTRTSSRTASLSAKSGLTSKENINIPDFTNLVYFLDRLVGEIMVWYMSLNLVYFYAFR